MPFTGTIRANSLDAVGNLHSLPRCGRSYAANTNSIYVFGGIDTTALSTNIVQIMTILDGHLECTVHSMPAERFFPATAYYGPNGKIYVAGGLDGSFLKQSDLGV